jgi:GNAT superfamily N-acetyltransferase
MSEQSQAVGPSEQSLLIRRATPVDAEVCGKICFEAFGAIARQHNFPMDFPTPEISIGLLSMMFSHPSFYCVVAEPDGKLVGSNCLDERAAIAGVGPITVDAAIQNRTVGRQLMDAVMARATERKFVGMRLVQVAYHNRSLSLYAKLGFVMREPLSCMQGPAIQRSFPGIEFDPRERKTSRPATTCACECTGTTAEANWKMRLGKAPPLWLKRTGASEPTIPRWPSLVTR